MKRLKWCLLCLIAVTSRAGAQDEGWYTGAASVGSGEPLYSYDDQERWKHGYIQEMPFYGGWSYFRPYNYHHVFSQVPTAAGWGMSAGMPYSQQFWHKYERFTDLSRGNNSPLQPYEPPPKEFEHYPKPLRSGAYYTPAPSHGSWGQGYGQPYAAEYPSVPVYYQAPAVNPEVGPYLR